MPGSQPITVWLSRWREGDELARDQVFEAIHPELRQIAARLLQRERSDHTLEPNDLVNELCLRLFGKEVLSFQDRAHFLALAAKCSASRSSPSSATGKRRAPGSPSQLDARH